MYRKAPTQQEAEVWGLTVNEATGPPGEVWPDCMAAVNVFAALQTQWRVGMGGATGLDYAAIPPVLRLTGVARADWPQVFDDLRVLEDEALMTFREQQQAKK